MKREKSMIYRISLYTKNVSISNLAKYKKLTAWKPDSLHLHFMRSFDFVKK